MATEKPRFPITVDDELFEQIEEYRHINKITSRSKAAVELLKTGIEELKKQNREVSSPENNGSTDEAMRIFGELSPELQDHALKQIELIYNLQEQIKEGK